MSNHLAMYVVSNGELAREALNAVVMLVSTCTFKTALKIGILFSILGGVLNYMRNHDLAALGKWFAIYFGITVIMLYPINKPLVIYDISNISKSYTVANVPCGLAFPASIITSVSYGLVQAFEMAFSMPDDVQYHKTGMLFGSKLFRLSTEVQLVDPVVRAELDDYVKSCVLGDILIAKKYSMTKLRESPNLLETITENTSSIRGIYVEGKFKVCKEAAADLKAHLTKEVNGNIFKQLARKLGWGSKQVLEIKTSEGVLKNVYDFFNYDKLSKGALDIATQNLLINGIRDGILNYTAETGSTAALLNLSTFHALDKMRLTMATSRNMAIYTIPIIHTILLLLMLSIFPLIVLLALQPGLTGMVLKNYIYTLIWIESWPLMFACLNMVLTYYGKDLGAGGLTLSSVDSLLLEHSDIANMAGYLMLSIPFISGGLVKGMSSAFNHAASYIGGALQSSASAAASEAASGNINLGNASWNNVNANKYDTNSTLMRGKGTEQLESGLLRTTMADGKVTYDGSPAISRLPTSVRSSELLNTSFTKQAEASQTASLQKLKSYDQNMSHAVSDFSSLSKTLGSGKSIGESLTDRETVSTSEHFADMQNIAKNIAERNHLDVNDVFRGLVTFSQGGEASLGLSTGKLPAFKVTDASVRGKLATEHLRSQETTTQHGVGRSIDITAEEAQRFSKDLNKVEEYSKTSHADTSHSTAASQLAQLSTDLRNSRSSLEQYSVHKADAERASKVASYVRQNSSQIDSDLGQEIVEYAVKKVGREEAEQLFAGKNRPQLEAIAKEYITHSGLEGSIMVQYQRDSSTINPEQRYHAGEVEIKNRVDNIGSEHESYKRQIDADAKAGELGVDEQKFDHLKNTVARKQKKIGGDLETAKNKQSTGYKEMHNRVAKDIKTGSKKAESSAFSIGSIKPDFAKSDKSEK